MSYKYATQKAELLTEDGIETLLRIRDEARRLLGIAGAFRADKAMLVASGSTWTMLAALDYMVEKKELRLVSGEAAGQHQVYIAGTAGFG